MTMSGLMTSTFLGSTVAQAFNPSTHELSMLQDSLKQVQGQPELHSETSVSNQPNKKNCWGVGQRGCSAGKALAVQAY